MVTQMAPMCQDTCGKAFLVASGCDMGEKSEKVCELKGDCKTKVCDIKAKCDGADPPPMFADNPEEFTEGRKEFMDAEASCSLCAPASTDAGTRQILSGLATALLYA